MIRIKKMVLKNFKSFRKADIPLASGFTAIVGSNGSGKSNILDALLFVLGISSLKALRASRMTDLVNNQAQEDYAKVEIEIEDQKKEKTWLVSRTVDKQGRAVVRLDEKRVALNEVAALLEELGINPTGHNIVVQGDVTRIVEMNDVQRREMIDDVAGIREFDEKREESFKELQKVDQKIKEVRIVLSERETYLEELAKEREAALQFNRLTDELKQTKATLFKGELTQIEQKIEKNTAKKQDLQTSLDEKAVRLQEDRAELEKIEQKIEAFNQQLILASEKTYSGIGMLVEEKRSEKRVREERQLSLQENLQKNLEKINLLRERNQAARQEQTEKQRVLEKKQADLRSLEQSISELKKKQEQGRLVWKEKSKDLDALEEQLAEQQTHLEKTRQELFEKHSHGRALSKAFELKKQALSELATEKEQVDEKLAQHQKKKDLLSTLLSKNPQPETALKEIINRFSESQRQIAYLESKADSLKETIARLEKAVANCPTCDSALSLEHKKRVLESKKKELVSVSKESANQNATKKDAREKQEQLELVILKKHELEIALAGFKGLDALSFEIEQKMQRLKTELAEPGLEKTQSEAGKLEKKTLELQEEYAVTQSEIDAFKKAHSIDALSADSEEFERLSKKFNEQKGLQKELELEIQLVLGEELTANEKNQESLRQENEDTQKRVQAEENHLHKIKKELEHLELELAKSEKASKDLLEQKQHWSEKISAQKQKIVKTETKQKETENALNELAIENSRLEVRQADLRQEAIEFETIQTFETFELNELHQRIPLLEKQIQKLGAINQKAVEHFGEFEQELLEVKKRSDKLEEERLAVLDLIKKIEDRRTTVFLDCFNAINRHFNDIFFTLAEGEAKLSLTDPQKPLESGLIIEARMKNKPIYSMDSMSGGEKTLTALAFLFALQMYNPAPFYVFDEADAALDKENSAKLGKIIAQISQTSQFIGITHNDTIVREADQIIGVALNEQKSSVIGLRLREKAAA